MVSLRTNYFVQLQWILIVLINLYGLNTVQGMDMLKVCKGVNLDVAEKNMMSVKECLKEAGATDMLDMETAKMPCFGKCVMVKRGAIDAKGMPHHENIKTMIKDDMPAVVHDELIKQMDSCLDKESIGTIDPTDESCTTYLPLMMCMHSTFIEVCEQ